MFTLALHESDQVFWLQFLSGRCTSVRALLKSHQMANPGIREVTNNLRGTGAPCLATSLHLLLTSHFNRWDHWDSNLDQDQPQWSVTILQLLICQEQKLIQKEIVC